MATAPGTSQGVSTLTAALGSRIRRHGQPGGEENLVLERVFHDELGSYRAGSWLIVGGGNQVPLAVHLLQAPQQKADRKSVV